jgi:hypothetical protein
MVQDRRNLERMYEQRERDYQRNEMRQAEARAREAEMREEGRRQRDEQRRDREEIERQFDRMNARSYYDRAASSDSGGQSGILGALVLGLLLAAVGAAAWWSFKLLAGASATCCGWSAGAASRPSRSPAATRGRASSRERVGAAKFRFPIYVVRAFLPHPQAVLCWRAAARKSPQPS